MPDVHQESFDMFEKLSNLIAHNPWKALFAVVALMYGAYVIWQFLSGAYTTKEGSFNNARIAKIHVLVWTIGPPLWFFIEYYLLTPSHDLAAVKQGQDLASKFWAAVLASILFLKPK